MEKQRSGVDLEFTDVFFLPRWLLSAILRWAGKAAVGAGGRGVGLAADQPWLLGPCALNIGGQRLRRHPDASEQL